MKLPSLFARPDTDGSDRTVSVVPRCLFPSGRGRCAEKSRDPPSDDYTRIHVNYTRTRPSSQRIGTIFFKKTTGFATDCGRARAGGSLRAVALYAFSESRKEGKRAFGVRKIVLNRLKSSEKVGKSREK